MKTYDKYEHTIVDYGYFSDLMVYKQHFASKKKPVSGNHAVYTLMSGYLEGFGIHLFGYTSLWNEEATVESYPQVLWCRLKTKSMPLENLEILPKIYPWRDCWVDIGLTYEGEECDYSMLYNPDTDKCKLRKHVHGHITIIKEFSSAKELVNYFNNKI